MRRDMHGGLASAIPILAVAVITAIATAGAVAQPRPSVAQGAGSAATATKVTVALLPLDAEARLALYGQPVASELSRALAAEGLDVVVVGQGDPVPTRAVLVVDGTLAKKGKGVALRLRIRDPDRAEVLAEVSATAASLTAIDKAAAEIAQKLIPKVREQLAARTAPIDHGSGSAGTGSAHGSGSAGSGSAAHPDRDPTPAQDPPVLLVASSRVGLDGRPDAMVAAFAPAFERLIGAAHHRAVASTMLVGDSAQATATAVRAAGAHVGITVEVLELRVEAGRIPLARARARIRIIDDTGTAVFDRVVRTDTLVGRRGEVAAHMAGYAAAQLAEVVRTRLRKAVARAP